MSQRATTFPPTRALGRHTCACYLCKRQFHAFTTVADALPCICGRCAGHFWFVLDPAKANRVSRGDPNV